MASTKGALAHSSPPFVRYMAMKVTGELPISKERNGCYSPERSIKTKIQQKKALSPEGFMKGRA